MLLAHAAGFEARASDGPLGLVETPLFPSDGADPDFLLLRVGTWPRVRWPVVPAFYVDEVDPLRRVVFFRGARAELEQLPEHLPVAS
jgi:hypothetical protein